MSLVTSYTGDRLKVAAGRVTQIDVGGSVLDVLERPQGGNVTVNSDGTLALVLPDPDQRGEASFTLLIDKGNGPQEVKIDLGIEGGSVSGGWGAGDYYTLETDDNDISIVEPGENHRKVFVTESAAALSVADIAAREGVKESAIDGEWLAAHPEYGASEDMALDTEAGMSLWFEITGRYTAPSSHHLLFEKGYEYDGTDRIIDRGTVGESALHPVLIGTWGNGAAPVIEDRWTFTQEKSENVVFRGLDFAQGGSIVGSGENVIFDDVVLRNNATVVQAADHVTLRNLQILDVSDSNKTNGLYVQKSVGLLLENILADHNGWEEGWEDGDGNAPNAFNHNIYVQWSNEDVTLRDSVTMQGSSFGAQIRSGGFIENNAFLDNNVALNVKGGNYRDGDYSGNYSLVLDNVVSSGANKDGAGAQSWGVRNLAPGTSFIDNIIAHLADPADPEELADRTRSPHDPLYNKFVPFVDNTIIYKWVSEALRDDRRFQTDSNVPDISEATLDEVTLRSFVETVANGKDPGDVIATLSDWLRDNWNTVAGSDIVEFFQDGFDIERKIESAPQTLRFEPDVRGEGTRWDNRLNWTGDEAPKDGDSIDLAGNWVSYSGTTDIRTLDLGEGGALTVRQGRLNVDDLQTDADSRIETGLAGQIWIDGYDGGEILDVDVSGGRFANTGTITGPVDISVSAGEALLATAGARLDLNGRLAIEGSTAKVGFDGQGGTAGLSLTAGAELLFAPDARGVSSIREFRSGAWGLSGSDLVSSVDLGDGNTTLTLDLGAFAGKDPLTLIEADTLFGGFGEIAVTGGKDAVTVRIDYASDRVDLVAGSASAGPSLEFVGSTADDVFVLADGADASIEAYAKGDRIDLSAFLQPEDLSGLNLSEAGGAVTLVNGSEVLARIEGSASDKVWVNAGGLQGYVDASGASGIEAFKGGSVPAPAPDPEPTPDPEPVPSPEPVPDPEPVPEPEPGNAAPVASDNTLAGDADDILTGLLEAADADGDDLVFALVDQPRTGEVTLESDGTFSYDPQGAFDKLPDGEIATLQFEFTVSDGNGGSDRAVVTLALEGQHSAPEGESSWNHITGTRSFDRLDGTDGQDFVHLGSGGYDRITGGADADAFVIGENARDGSRSTDQILDFDAGEDRLVLEAGIELSRMEMQDDTLWITLEGDNDLVLISGPDVAPDSIEIVQSDDAWLG